MEKTMKILLIFPKAKYAPANVKKEREVIQKLFGEAVSLTLPQVAAATPEGHDIEIVDENYETIDFNSDVDLVGITCLTMTANRAYQIADTFRKKGITVVLGGNHPSALPEEAIRHADSVVVGEAEITWRELLKDFQNGCLHTFYISKKEIPSEFIRAPRRDLIKRRYYSDGLLMRRGCPNRCEFCTVTSLHSMGEKPLEKVFDEIQKIHAKTIFIYDQNFTWQMDYSRKLLNELKTMNKRWLANGTANILGKNDMFLQLAQEARFFGWYIGFESISQKSLDGVKKKVNKVEEYASIIKKIKSYGMVTVGSFVFGFDGDTPNIFDDTLHAINEWGLEMAEFHILTPFPGTALYKRLKQEDRILTENWSKYTTTNVVFEPKNMSVNELYEGTKRIAKKFYSVPNIIKRIYQTMETTKDLFISSYVVQRNFKYRERYKNQFDF
jgi:radical SAM superfamily enzyme YgiQ (UPF0313 family)